MNTDGNDDLINHKQQSLQQMFNDIIIFRIVQLQKKKIRIV